MSAKLHNGHEYIEIKKISSIDDDIEIEINAKSSFIKINFNTYIFSYALKDFYSKLQSLQTHLSGQIVEYYFNYEKDFKIDITYLTGGHVSIEAFFKSNNEFGNMCNLAFETDQTFISEFLDGLKSLI